MTEILMARKDDVDGTAAAASAAAAAVSATAAAADAVTTAADVVLTNADVVLTGLDVTSTGNDVTSTNADVVTTNADVVLTAADVVLTGLDVISTAADVVTAAASAATAAAASESPALNYNYNTTTSQGAAAGTIRFNNTTLSSATQVFVADDDADGNDHAAYIQAWATPTSTVRAYLHINNVTVPGVTVFSIDSADTDNAGDTTHEITYISGPTTITNGNLVTVFAGVSGDAGAGLGDVVDDTSPELGGQLDALGVDIIKIGVLTLLEQAAAESNVATRGQIWVKTASPNLLMFSDDAGGDFQVATLTGTETLSAKTMVAPALGTPASGVLTNMTGLPTAGLVDDAVTYVKMQNVVADNVILGNDAGAGGVVNELTATEVRTIINVENAADVTDATNVNAAGAAMNSDFGTGIEAWLADPTSAKLITAVTNETGTGVLVFGTAPTLTAATMAGTLSCADNIVERPMLKDYGEVNVAKGNLGATPAFDMSAGNVQSGTVDQTITSMTITNETASDDTCSLTLILTNAEAFDITWDTTIDWPTAQGGAPTLTASGVDILVFVTIDGGATWHGSVASLNSV